MPILLAKLWSVMPKLFEWPPIRSIAHLLERALAGAAGRRQPLRLLHRRPEHPGLLPLAVPLPHRPLLRRHSSSSPPSLLHVSLKLPIVLQDLPGAGSRCGRCAPTSPTPLPSRTKRGRPAPLEPAAPTISRRAMLATVGAASVGVGFDRVSASRSAGRCAQLGLLAPRSTQLNNGPNGFQINKTAASGRHRPAADRRRLAPEAGRGDEGEALPRAAAGDAPAHLRPADRLRRRLVDHPALDRRAAERPGRRGRASPGAGEVLVESLQELRRAAQGDAQLRPDRRRAAACWR